MVETDQMKIHKHKRCFHKKLRGNIGVRARLRKASFYLKEAEAFTGL